jgi:hypothetical protein
VDSLHIFIQTPSNILHILNINLTFVYKIKKLIQNRTLFSFLGGFLGTNIMVTFPCAIFMKMHGINKKTIFILIICSITVVLGYIGSVLSLVHKS